jgi:hypothetical protein
MKIRAPQDYRAAVEEAQRVADAPEGTAQFGRRQELTAAMHERELRHLAAPDCQRSRPPGSI